MALPPFRQGPRNPNPQFPIRYPTLELSHFPVMDPAPEREPHISLVRMHVKRDRVLRGHPAASQK